MHGVCLFCCCCFCVFFLLLVITFNISFILSNPNTESSILQNCVITQETDVSQNVSCIMWSQNGWTNCVWLRSWMTKVLFMCSACYCAGTLVAVPRMQAHCWRRREKCNTKLTAPSVGKFTPGYYRCVFLLNCMHKWNWKDSNLKYNLYASVSQP